MKAMAWLAVLGWSFAGQVVSFDNSKVGTLPLGWSVAMTHRGAPATWVVQWDPTAAPHPHVLAQTSVDPEANRFPIAIFDPSWLRDGDISVRIKPVAGREDRAGGIVWRYRDANNYYLARVNALENNVMAFKMVNGHRIPLAGGVSHHIPSNSWIILKVSARGTSYAIYVNHRRVFQGNDTTFAGPGKTGLWTKSDSVTYFDDFRLDPR